MIVTKAIFSYLRDFQYPFVSCDILSNCRHYVSFGHKTRVTKKVRRDLEDRLKDCRNIRVMKRRKRYVISFTL